MTSARGRGGRGRRGRGGEALLPTTWPGSFGPTVYDAPLDILPVQGRAYYAPPNSLRPYDDRRDEWPVCHHGESCLVQLYDGYGEASSASSDARMGNCRFAKWVDPPVLEVMQEYIHHLKNRIFDLESRVQTLEDQEKANPWVISIAGDPLCPDPWCKCSYHLNKDRPPSPPSSGGAGFYEAGGPSQYSQSQHY
ncbi:unnamed protein product [Urochloa decumbens]|uniref:Uncharacterized protein n=1 Tax=Urochloa decumbens TaxID=240449 RepID=A0ABC9E830_9POAL